MAKNLGEIKPGGKCRVIRTVCAGEFHKRITEMGIIAGALVEVERVAPLGDPVEFKIMGCHLSLRKAEAAGIEVNPV